MSFTISNNSAVAASSYHLGKNQQALQLSIKKLASALQTKTGRKYQSGTKFLPCPFDPFFG
jgi:hypothetical protein